MKNLHWTFLWRMLCLSACWPSLGLPLPHPRRLGLAGLSPLLLHTAALASWTPVKDKDIIWHEHEHDMSTTKGHEHYSSAITTDVVFYTSPFEQNATLICFLASFKFQVIPGSYNAVTHQWMTISVSFAKVVYFNPIDCIIVAVVDKGRTKLQSDGNAGNHLLTFVLRIRCHNFGVCCCCCCCWTEMHFLDWSVMHGLKFNWIGDVADGGTLRKDTKTWDPPCAFHRAVAGHWTSCLSACDCSLSGW